MNKEAAMSKYRITRIALAVAAAGAVGAGTAATGAFAASSHAAPSVKLGSVTVSGAKQKLLMTSTGKPVYLLTGDSMKTGLCTSAACLKAWPAVTASSAKPTLGAGVMGKLTVWNHKGLKQLVLNGHPLYTFAADKGSTASGQGIKAGKAVWEVVTASGAGLKPAASSGTTSTSSSSGSSSSGSSTTSTSSSGSWS
jgi:predicted lipoprotein with Yx(FWY)xxD motif